MALLWLPDATKDQHSTGLTWTETTDPKGLLHTTEGNSWPTYQGWTIEPHATVMPTADKGVTIRQHIPFDHGSFSLQHTETQPTNTDFVFQFELVGTCDPNGPASCYYWPEADDAVLLDLFNKVIKPLSDAYDIPLHTPKWLAYPASFGDTSVRLTNAQFDIFTGWLGHEHVPQNSHGDPGLFPWGRMMAIGADMPLTDDDVAKIWAYPIGNLQTDDSTDKMPAANMLAWDMRWSYLASVRANDALAKISAITNIDVDALAAALATDLAPVLAALPEDVFTRIANSVADEESRRLSG